MKVEGGISHYAQHWGQWFKQHRPTEWHCTAEEVMALMQTYLEYSASSKGGEGALLVDLGCGQSQVCMQGGREEGKE